MIDLGDGGVGRVVDEMRLGRQRGDAIAVRFEGLLSIRASGMEQQLSVEDFSRPGDLKLDEIGQTRAALNTAQNRLQTQLEDAQTQASQSRETLLFEYEPYDPAVPLQ